MRMTTILVAALMLTSCVGNLFALTKEELQGLAFQAIHSGDSEIRDAHELLVNKKVLVERPEKQWELAAEYHPESHPEIAKAIVVLQQSQILNVRPLNWEGSDNAVEILVDKEEIFPRALEMIERAERTIRFNIFLWGGEIGTKMVEAFKRAKDRGVSIQIITMPDSEGSNMLKHIQKISNKLAGDEPLKPYQPIKHLAVEAGLSIAYYPVKKLNGKAFVKADHNKMLSIDGQEAMIGGMNFADAVSNNHDLMVWIKGPAVTELVRIFHDNWRICSGKNLYEQEAMPLWDQIDDVLDAATAKRCRDLAHVTVAYSNACVNATRSMVADLFDNAKKKIRVMMFTFTDDDTVEKLIAAHKRGVDVKVILDPNVHAFGLRLMGAPNISTVRQLKKAGIEVRAYQTRPGAQMHIKSCMIDDVHCCFGSTNFTKAGFDSNNETFVKVTSKDVAEDFTALFELDWEEETYVLKSDGLGKWMLSGLSELFDNGF